MLTRVEVRREGNIFRLKNEQGENLSNISFFFFHFLNRWVRWSWGAINIIVMFLKYSARIFMILDTMMLIIISYFGRMEYRKVGKINFTLHKSYHRLNVNVYKAIKIHSKNGFLISRKLLNFFFFNLITIFSRCEMHSKALKIIKFNVWHALSE